MRPLEFYYPLRIGVMALPWVALLPAAVVYFRRRRRAPVLMLGCATLSTVACLSISEGQRGYYSLPVMPFVFALMAGAGARLARRWGACERGRARARTWLRAHVVAIAIGAVAAGGTIGAKSTELELPNDVVIASVALLALALLACGASWNATPGRPIHAALWLFGGLGMVVLAIADSGIAWDAGRYTGGQFARRVEQVLDPDRDLVMIGGDQQVLVHYTDRPVRRLTSEEARSLLAVPDGPTVVSLASQLAGLRIGGRVLVEERVQPGDDPQVLVAHEGAISN
jgi:hypothetical protein